MKRLATAIVVLVWLAGCGDAQGSAASDTELGVARDELRFARSPRIPKPPNLAALMMRRTADLGGRTAALEAAAHRLSELQADTLGDNAQNGFVDLDPDDGGWDWVLALEATEHSAAPSPENVYGATALGAWAGARANPSNLRFVMSMLDAAQGTAARSGVDSPPDFVYLVMLAEHSNNAGFAELARIRYETRLDAAGGAQAAGEYIRDARAASGANGLIAYDLAWMILAARLLDATYPEAGFDEHAALYGGLVYGAITAEPPLFDTEDANAPYATQGLAWAAVALRWSGVGSSLVPKLSRRLIQRQLEGGAWGFNATFPEPDPQATAHAVLALSLLKAGFGRRCAAAAGAAWLTALQRVNGGWEHPAGQETPLVNGEIALSLALAPEAPPHCPRAAARSEAAEADGAVVQRSRSSAARRPGICQPL